MRRTYQIALLVALLLLTIPAVAGCGGGATAETESTAQSATTAQSSDGQTATTASAVTTGTSAAEQSAGQAETEVSGMPEGFPSDVPVHPGTVTAYEPTKVTDSMTVHQLTVTTAASLGDVVDWYKTKLPDGWTVGFLENKDGEAKIALNGGDYTPAKADGNGGGVLIGLVKGEQTTIVVTVTVTAK